MRLTGPEHEELTNALLDAYPDQDGLEMMLEVKLEKRLSTLAQGNSLWAIIFKLIGRAESEGWTDKLIIAAHERNPGNEMLEKCYQKYILKKPKQEQIMEVTSEETSGESQVYEQLSELDVKPDKVKTEVFGQSETSSVSARSDALLQDFLASKHSHLAMIIQVAKPFNEGRIIYSEHCDRAIKSLDNLDESVQRLRKTNIEYSYNVMMALNHISKQINELRIDLHQFRRISSSLTSTYLKEQQYSTGYRTIRSRFDMLLKSLELFLIED